MLLSDLSAADCQPYIHYQEDRGGGDDGLVQGCKECIEGKGKMSSLHNVYGKNLANVRDEKVTPAVQYD
jgi:hypothetical protein